MLPTSANPQSEEFSADRPTAVQAPPIPDMQSAVVAQPSVAQQHVRSRLRFAGSGRVYLYNHTSATTYRHTTAAVVWTNSGTGTNYAHFPIVLLLAPYMLVPSIYEDRLHRITSPHTAQSPMRTDFIASLRHTQLNHLQSLI